MNKFQFAQRNAVITAHQSAIRIELARHPAVKQILALFPPKLRNNVRLTLNEYSSGVQFTLTLNELDSFKDKMLTKLLAKRGVGMQQQRLDEQRHAQPGLPLQPRRGVEPQAQPPHPVADR